MSRVWLDADEIANRKILIDDMKRNLKIIRDFINHHHQPSTHRENDHAIQPRHLRRHRT